MDYKKILWTLGLIILSVISTQNVDAARLNPQQALSRAQGSTSRLRLPGSDPFELTYTGKSAGENALYVFNKGQTGFIVVSADDRLPALLGYSDNGAFDEATVSPELKWWLSQYADETIYFFHNESRYTNTGTSGLRRTARPAIEPLVKTKWNQTAPYNNDCPSDAGGRCVTGCVATAMAQVMKYHNYPASGSGNHSYVYKGNTYSFDFGATIFDWSNMLDAYTSSATEAQNAAVATLMHACGVSVNMAYSSGTSGAGDSYVPYALKEYFSYDAGVRYLEREYFSDEEWEKLIYNELAAKRPVIYGGQASGGGHEFVCDGYNEEGYFHINWGWGGHSDGYFLLSLLNPNDQGTGSFEGGYNSDQTAIIGIQRPTDNSTACYPVYSSGSFVYGGLNNNTLTYSISNGYMYCLYPTDVTVNFYMKAVSEESNQEYYSSNGVEFPFSAMKYDSETGTSSYTLYNSFEVEIPSIPTAGKYKAYPVFKGPDGDYQDLLVPSTEGLLGYIDMTINENGNAIFEDENIEPRIEVTNLEPTDNNSKIVPGQSTKFNIVIKNVGEVLYSGYLIIRLFKPNSNTSLGGTRIAMAIPVGGTINGTTDLTFSSENVVSGGDYELKCFNKDNEEVSEPFPIKIYMNVSGVTLDKTTANMEVGATLQLKATVEPDYAVDETVNWSSSDESIATVDENGLVKALALGEATITATSNSNANFSANCVITVTKTVPITKITLNRESAEVEAGETLQLTATVEPDDATDKSLVWTSSDKKIATVDQNGLVTAVAKGEVTITVTSGADEKISASCTLSVLEKTVPVTGITLDRESAEVEEGATLQLTATVEPENATDKSLVWTSSDKNIATVDENGLVTAVAKGEVTITVTSGSDEKISASCTLSVVEKTVSVTKVTLDRESAEVEAGATLQLTATVEPEAATDKSLIWTSSDEEIARVDENGLVTAVAKGEVTITVTSGSDEK
ncbi:MAG: Ig-like domain-containing protein, partial [Muribaculaceae bacterium]|nr:Ig-like domain-containing protein [Muribaculaceae bacterium]